MRQRDHDSSTDVDSHDDLFFATSDDDLAEGDPADTGDPARHGHRLSRLESRRRDRDRRRRGVFGVVGILFVIVLVAIGVLIGVPVYHYFHPSDYSGEGSGSVVVTVHANDGASQIGATLVSDHVVASEKAFTNAASDNAKSRNIQPGSYRMREHMSAKDAVTRLLDPSARVNDSIVVPEGATTFDVEARLSARRCTASSPSDTVCGLALDKPAVTKALTDVKALGLPTNFTTGGTPASAEGFLYPATYPFDDTTTAETALQTMVGRFTDQIRPSDFISRAKALGITPYQELVIASIVQSEAKYPDDMAKVARVILNRLHDKMPLQIDATSIYGAKVNGVDPTKIDHATYASPYNTYLHTGLTPTPISNPGAAALKAASHPATGNWTYYVNSSPDRLFFTDSESAFEKAKATCVAHNWGCG
ncbi:endolytic transglycosylase MltG [Jatrophihabitans endophyticus]|uniref:endolytic transglycosylase MltG n=1 Tax=Jatrophihabitans endophyticus TaxID=1206085 RepID=UPI0019FEEFCA|nr:endolytic transglycosylase MltG [Jatrophihabitans endophyticus]MBE7187520.1 endolytic transglycosylase MltG [Jatrophihabitans endophyticus]